MSKYEPATPFMEGYRRPDEMTERLIEVLTGALRENPRFRLGQLIAVATITDDLRGIWDEDLIDRLLQWTEIGHAIEHGVGDALAQEIHPEP